MHLVLVGDDGSEAAAGAVAWATQLATERDARLLVVQITGTGKDAPVGPPDERVEIVHEDHPASGITMTAQDRDADLIVLGRRGGGGFPSLPIGTTAHHVAAAAGRPVVVVPPMDEPPHQPLVQRVVVGIDGLPGSAEAAAWSIRNFGGAHFTVVHAVELAPVFAQLGDDNGELYDRAQARAAALLRDQWSRPFLDAGVAFDTVVEEGGPAEVVLRVATRTNADLVVVGRRGNFPMRGTLGGVSQRVLAYAPCAAATVPSPA